MYRANATPDPVSLADDSELANTWIALIPGDYPAHLFADDEVYHLSSGIAWPGPHHRDYGSARVAHDCCCPGQHTTRPDTSRGAGELWDAMLLRIARQRHQR